MISELGTALVRGTVGAVLLVPVIGVASAQPGGGMGGMGSGMGGFGWWPLLWSLVLLSVVILVASGVLGYGRSSNDGENETDEALATLRTRYANGELSDEEFEDRRRRLEE